MWALTLVALVACGSGEPAQPVVAPSADAPAVPVVPASIDITGFHAKHEAGEVPLLIDVRTDEEWATGHVPGAVHLPMDQVDARLGELDSHKQDAIYVICASGGRSSRVTGQLRNKGYSAVSVDGGTSGWKAAGYPLE